MELNAGNVDIACFSEHWLQNHEKDIVISGFSSCSMYCRSSYKNGGVAMFCKNNLKQYVNELKFLQNVNDEKIIEVCGIEVTISKIAFRIITIYRSPMASFDSFIEKLDTVLNLVCKNVNCQIIVCGDLNIDFFSNSIAKKELVNTFLTYNLTNVVNEPTRISHNTSTCIDYICTNFNSFNMTCTVIENAISDHTAQVLSLSLNLRDYEENYIFTRLLSAMNYNTFASYVSRETWLDVYNCSDVNKAFEIFVNILKFYIDISFPIKKVNANQTKNKKNWVTKGIQISSKNLKYLYSRMKITNDKNDIDFYKRYKQVYRKVIKAAKNYYNNSYYNRTENKTKAVWNIINNNIQNKNTKRNISELHTKDNTLTDAKEIADFFNNYFMDVPEQLNNKLDNENLGTEFKLNKEYPTMFLDPVDEKTIYNAIIALKNSNSVGVDNISSNILKSVIHFVVQPFTYLINLSLERGVFPEILKTAKVVPLHKKGDLHLVDNYRPVSLLSTLSKIYERILYNRIIHFISRFNILNPQQHGFRKGKSTTSAIFDLLNVIYENIDDNKKTVGLFMDLSKAFDLVDHALLLKKMEAYGLRGKVNELLKSYLVGRKQLVEINNIKSHTVEIKYGVPQGSVLGPLLFLIFVNDLPNISCYQSNIIMFADDNSCLCSDDNVVNAVKETQVMLNKFILWFNSNRQFLNSNKTVFIHFTPRLKQINESYLLKCNGKSIEQVSETKFLGLYIDNSLSWEPHIDVLCKKMSSICFAFYRLKQVGNTHIMMSYYYAAMYSRLKYAIIFWGCSHHSIRLFRLQKRAVRCIANVSQLTSCRPIFRELKILTLPCIYIMEILLFVKLNYDRFMKNNHYHTYNTRRGQDLCLPIHTLAFFEKNAAYIGIQLFNKLPENIKYIENIHSFKKKVRMLLVKKVFYSVSEYLNESNL